MKTQEIQKEIEETQKSKSTKFTLKYKDITNLPETIGVLTEVEEMSLIGNQLSELPKSFSKLVNLKRLHLSRNLFEIIPPEIFKLPNLTHVCIRDNHINAIPENIGDLISIRDIDLDSNHISSIPLTLDNIEILKNLSLWDNPIIDPPFQVLNQGTEALKLYIEKKGRVLLYTINLPDVILTPFKQYLLSFPDFVKASKGRNIKVEVKTVEEGILVEVECEFADDLNKFDQYMSEYSGFVKQNVDDIEIKYEVQTFDAKKELLLHQTKQEVQFLKMKCDNIEFQNKFLTNEHDFMKNLVVEMAKQQPMLSFDIKQLQAPTFNNSVTFNITNHIEKLRDSVLDLSEFQEILEPYETELNKIKEELDALASLEEAEIKQSGVFDKLKSLVTTGFSLVKGADESFDTVSNLIEKLSKISELIKPFLQ